MRVAVIDIGSNSIHMLIAQVESDGRFRVLDRAKDMVRLGRSLPRNRLAPDAMRSSLRVLAAFRTLAERQGVTRFKAVATSAVREAANGGAFVKVVQDAVGLRVKVIPGREEARLISVAVRHAIDVRREPALILDLGGGSAELIELEAGEAVAFDSLKLGVARLAQQFITGDPPTDKSVRALERHLDRELGGRLRQLARRGVRRIVCTSGTLLNLIAMAGYLGGQPPGAQFNGYTVEADEVTRIRRRLCRADHDDRLRMKGLDAKRVDLIVPGALFLDYVAQQLRARELVACTWALREGVLLDFIARHRKGIEETERFADRRRRSVARFVRHLGETGHHGEHVAHLALRLFDQVNSGLGLEADAREWLEYASLLHDVGHHISHKHHDRHSHYLITNAELVGFRPQELEIIGQAVRYHVKGVPKAHDNGCRALPRPARDTVRSLSAILRLADGLDRSHYAVVRDITAKRRGKRLTLELHTGGEDAQLEVWEARRRAALLERLLGVDVNFKVVA